MTFLLRMKTLLISLLLLKTCSTFNLRTFSQVLASVIKIFQCSILHFQMCINSLNGEYYTIIDFNEVDIRIYLPEKVIIHRGR